MTDEYKLPELPEIPDDLDSPEMERLHMAERELFGMIFPMADALEMTVLETLAVMAMSTMRILNGINDPRVVEAYMDTIRDGCNCTNAGFN